MNNYITQANFSYNLALVQNQNGLFGYINPEGQEVIPCKYTSATSFYQGVAIVKKMIKGKEKCAIIDTKGTEDGGNNLLDFQYDDIYFGLYDTVFVTRSGKKGVLYKWCWFGIDIKFDEIQEIGNCLLTTKNNKETLYGLRPYKKMQNSTWIHKEGVFTEYTQVENVILVKNKKEKYGLLDLDGNITCDCVYDSLEKIGEFGVESLFLALKSGKNNEKYGIINQLGEIFLPFDYLHIIPDIKNNICSVAKKENEYGIVNLNNNVIIPFEYFYPLSIFGENTFIATAGQKYVIINHKNEVISPTFPFVQALDANVAVVVLEEDSELQFNYFSIIDSNSFKKVVPEKFQELSTIQFHENNTFHSVVVSIFDEKIEILKYGLFGIENKKMLIPCMYDVLMPHALQDYFLVGNQITENTTKYGVIDYKNNTILPLEFDQLDLYKLLGKLYFVVKKDENFAVLDNQNNTLFPFQPFPISKIEEENGQIVTHITENCYFDTEGKKLDLRVIYPEPKEEAENEEEAYSEQENNPINSFSFDDLNWEISYEMPENSVEIDADSVAKTYIHPNKTFTFQHAKNPENYLVGITENIAISWDNETNTYIFVNEFGKIIETKYPIVELGLSENTHLGFSNGLCVVYAQVPAKGILPGIIDKTGKFVFEPQYEQIIHLGNNVYKTFERKKYGLICYLNGKYCYLESNCLEDIIYTPWGIVTTQVRGMRPKHTTIEIHHITEDGGFWGTAIASDNTNIALTSPEGITLEKHYPGETPRYDFVDWRGNMITRRIFKDITPFKDGFAKGLSNGKWGVIDLKGNTIIPFEYDAIGDFAEGKVIVERYKKQVIG